MRNLLNCNFNLKKGGYDDIIKNWEIYKIRKNYLENKIRDTKIEIQKRDVLFERKVNVKKNRPHTKHKANMYKAVLKQIDNGSYISKADNKYEKLYGDFRSWGLAKEPKSMKIHENSLNPLTTRLVVESFAETKALTTRFTPKSPNEYYKQRYAGGPTSNAMKVPKINSSKIEYYVIKIQKRFRIHQAKKIRDKIKLQKQFDEIEARRKRLKKEEREQQKLTMKKQTLRTKQVEMSKCNQNKANSRDAHYQMLDDEDKRKYNKSSSTKLVGSHFRNNSAPHIADDESIPLAARIPKRKGRKKLNKQQLLLINACRKNNVVYVKKNLIRLLKSDFNWKDEHGNTPLYIAVTYGNLDIAEYLLRLGAEVNGSNQYGNTALHKAMLIDDWSIIFLLLQKGADVNALNSYNQAPTFFANKSLKNKIFIPTDSQTAKNNGKFDKVIIDYEHNKMIKMIRSELKSNKVFQKRKVYQKQKEHALMMGKPFFHIKTRPKSGV